MTMKSEIRTMALPRPTNIGASMSRMTTEDLHEALDRALPVSRGSVMVDWEDAWMGAPNTTPDECRMAGTTYDAPMYVKLRIMSYDNDVLAGTSTFKIRMGRVPIPDDRGLMILNGMDRVIVGKLSHSPGMLIRRVGGRPYVRIMPEKGIRLIMEIDRRGFITATIGRASFPATLLLASIGYTMDFLTRWTGPSVYAITRKGRCYASVSGLESMKDMVLDANIDIGNETVVAGTLITQGVLRRIQRAAENNGIKMVQVPESAILGRFTATETVLDNLSIGRLTLLRESHLRRLIRKLNTKKCKKRAILVNVMHPYYHPFSKSLSTHRELDAEGDAATALYMKMHGHQPPKKQDAATYVANTLYGPEFNLTQVGRINMDGRLKSGDEVGHLRDPVLGHEGGSDLLEMVRIMLDMHHNGELAPDDMDDLSMKRVTGGRYMIQDLITNIWSSSLADSLVDHERDWEALLKDAGNTMTKAALHAFLHSPLSQIADQVNPLAEVSHTRRIVSSSNARRATPSTTTPVVIPRTGETMREVHMSYYGKICPVETPEGTNIGLVNSLAAFARIDRYGMLSAPYRRNGKVGYLSISAEKDLSIGFADGSAGVRNNGELLLRRDGGVDCKDMCSQQMMSVSANLVPFLEHTDSSRLLMAVSMMKQAVPLVAPEAPLVQTGMERYVAEMGDTIISDHSGVVSYVDANRITVTDGRHSVTYRTKRHLQTNQGTWLDQPPCIEYGQKISKGQLLTNGSAIRDERLALGRNIRAAYMSWHGYNFEDAIVVSSRIVETGAFESIHIKELTCSAVETQIGNEEITADIPSVALSKLAGLDEGGVVSVGSYVKPGDILVGKVAPKPEEEGRQSPEDQLFGVLFGDKVRKVRNVSLMVPHGVNGKVIGVTANAQDPNDPHVQDMLGRMERLQKLIMAENIRTFIHGKIDMVAKRGKISYGEARKLMLRSRSLPIRLRELVTRERQKIADYTASEKDRVTAFMKRAAKNATLPKSNPALKEVKVSVASRHNLEVGDKLAGRHGNKGVVSIIVPQEDMPFMEDGTPVDVILSPLGVPSRMNIGQLLDAYLGDVLAKTGEIVVGPIFNGMHEDDIRQKRAENGLPPDGQYRLQCGQTGEEFDLPITVGVLYLMKLNHMVSSKMHVRSTGPYSVVTQQPIRGRSKGGGQRLGEMEVWALQGSGAAYTLREMLSIKSDDVHGRNRAYNSMCRDRYPDWDNRSGNILSLPEATKVVLSEMRAIGLDVDLMQDGKQMNYGVNPNADALFFQNWP